jgi:hypothetical protein
LRAIDRYGVTSRGEQYRGWNALPSGIEVPSAAMTLDEAARLVAEHSDVTPEMVRSSATARRAAYKAAARRLHPDAGGDEVAFQQLQDAMRLLGGEVDR